MSIRQGLVRRLDERGYCAATAPCEQDLMRRRAAEAAASALAP
jgi:hypothetical protein